MVATSPQPPSLWLLALLLLGLGGLVYLADPAALLAYVMWLVLLLAVGFVFLLISLS